MRTRRTRVFRAGGENAKPAPRIAKLSVAQEEEIVADPKLFLATWLLVNGSQFDDILKEYRF
ncbi:MAG TPA: hypothetical protein VHK24_14865, partial [Steroidobacter sp.]|nr:hypothetical protein [Steroidobacter sp.]